MEAIKNSKHKLLTLFISIFYISAFTFGGGFVIVTLMKKKFVEELKWLDEQEMLDFTALAQSSPGAIAVNAAILVGWKVGGLVGMFIAVFACILPPMIIIGIISMFYIAFSQNEYVKMVLGGMSAGVAAVILDVSWELGEKVYKQKNYLDYIIFALAFIASFVMGINVIYIILAAMVVGVARSLIKTPKPLANKEDVQEVIKTYSMDHSQDEEQDFTNNLKGEK